MHLDSTRQACQYSQPGWLTFTNAKSGLGDICQGCQQKKHHTQNHQGCGQDRLLSNRHDSIRLLTSQSNLIYSSQCWWCRQQQEVPRALPNAATLKVNRICIYRSHRIHLGITHRTTRDQGTEKPCNVSELSSEFAGLLAKWQRGPALQCRRA